MTGNLAADFASSELNGIFLDPSVTDTSDQYSGPTGDGSGSTPDLLNTVLNSQVASSLASSTITALFGGQKVVAQNPGNAGTSVPIQKGGQGGTIGSQSQVTPWYKNIPGWTWILAAAAFFAGMVVFFWPKKT